MQLEVGQVVTSRAGRDVTKVYAVTGFRDGKVLVADGNRRTLALPKVKNPNHLAPTLTVLTKEQMQTDAALKGALAAYTEHAASNKKEDG